MWKSFLSLLITGLLAGGCFRASGQQNPEGAEVSMVSPAIDDPAKPWCYLQHSTTLVGVPYMPDAIQVTYDGALYTGHAELCFFYGRPLRPVLVRQKSWQDGGIPIVQYDWKDDTFTYRAEMFGAVLEGEDAGNTLQFVKITITNISHKTASPAFAAATRSTGQDYRFGGGKFSPAWKFGIKDGKIIREGKLVFTFPAGARFESVCGKKYIQPFRAADVNAKKNTPLCLVNFTPSLSPEEKVQYSFKMPRLPVDTADKALISKITSADYDVYKVKTIRYWQDRVWKNRMDIHIPEKRVNDAVRAGIVHMMLATRGKEGKRFMTDGLPYPNLFLTSFVQHEEAFDFFGLKEFTDESLPVVYAKQDSGGLFYDGALLHGKKLGVAQGQTIQMLCEHYFLTGDKPYMDSVYPKIKAAVAWIRDAVIHDKYHLMPPAWPYDNEMILGHYTSNNLWALLGLRSAIRIARLVGHKEDAAQWTKFEQFYRASLLKAIKVTFEDKGYIPPGLYKYATGEAARAGFAEWQTNQEWENMMLLYPTELLPPGSPIVSSTLKRIRQDRYREGIMTYRIYLHQYITINMMDQELALGDAKDALIDLYNVLLHLGSTYEGFENLVKPWQDREVSPDCPAPHAWAASKLVCFIRNMLVREYGGEAGLDESQRGLYLFSLVSPDWCVSGKEISFTDARTEMGTLSASMKFTSSGAEVNVNPDFRTKPHRIAITIPYFVHLEHFTSDASMSEQKGNQLFFSPDVRRINIVWKKDPRADEGTFADILQRYRSESTLSIADEKEVITPQQAYLSPAEQHYPPAPLSFELVKKAFVHEYSRRYEAFKAKGGHIDTLKAPPLLIGH